MQFVFINISSKNSFLTYQFVEVDQNVDVYKLLVYLVKL